MGKGFSVTIAEGKLYMILPMRKDFFENITISKRQIDVNSLEAIKDELNIIKQLLDTLNLNNRIWLKQ